MANMLRHRKMSSRARPVAPSGTCLADGALKRLAVTVRGVSPEDRSASVNVSVLDLIKSAEEGLRREMLANANLQTARYDGIMAAIQQLQ